MSNLLMRILTAAVIIPPVVAVILWAPLPAVAATCAVLAALAGREFHHMTIGRSARATTWFAVLFPAAGTMAVWYYPTDPMYAFVLLLALVPAAFLATMWQTDDVSLAFTKAAFLITGTLYTATTFGALAQIASVTPNGRDWTLALVAAVTASDTGAYTAGRLWGRHRLHPVLSPKKTWEGAVGGLVAACVTFVAVLHWLVPTLPLPVATITAVLLGIAAQTGDMMESFVKRACDVKDAGRLIPGHGGVLDRCDALMIAALIVLAAIHHLP